MKYYLSSYKFGNCVDSLKQMLPKGARIAHINNARDSKTISKEIRNKHLKEEMVFMDSLGFISEHLDLKNYFYKKSQLRKKMDSFNGVWVCGGNAFVLRQAMKLSGFDNIFNELHFKKDFFYGGYSAGICVLSDSLKYIQSVDKPNDFPYKEINETIWDGLNVFSYGILPHYKSNHPESEAIGKAVNHCIDNKWLFKTLRDGEVMIHKTN
ncbi:Type 1 glutamine amidotransferase-like domain-containing protein [Hwangdonia lutea]|uniref:Type 1 glutamine amidotransferase-like domain-containing protein n=1 Tax=Hwangdonia lutea TaxID=3075823 RepID=A0AA97EMD6_9FLAO|nr:Type 1 glutamine amidotransferase-like domain-containing protein [Hwangdonia sp. SCSIO 19198]WOD44081.1 Type 1 glutamine amidotransferase-like domain-containing protein [Hwangdonia sp. SCSIO 19198]